MAFTLVELLVVVAIIGTLVALLLPAVQSARETSRRHQCQNNLRQIGIALALYANAQAAFPIGCLGPSWTTNRHISWNVQVLPFIDEQPLREMFDFQLASFHPTNRAVGSTVVGLFLCPSTEDPQLLNPAGAWKGTAFTDYAGIYGVEGSGRDVEIHIPSDEGDEDTVRQIQTVRDDSLGILIYDESVLPRQITDGMSKSACVAETEIRRQVESEWINGENILAQDESTPINGAGLNNEIGSPHRGGASLVFCDAHVEFIAESIDQAVLNALLTKAGGER